MHEPKNLKEMQNALTYYDRLMNEIPIKEKEFPKIADQFAVLEKYQVEVEEPVLKRHKALVPKWTQYLTALGRAEEMLHRNKEMFRAGLLEKAEQIKSEVMELGKTLFETMPTSSDFAAKGKLLFDK